MPLEPEGDGYWHRPEWDDYFLGIAEAVSMRGECSRRRVGAVLVKADASGRRLIRATGYNGAPAGAPSCLKGACPRAFSNAKPGSSYDTGAGSCIAVHAEGNVLLYASPENCEDATLYLTDEPCGGCERLILGAGVARVVYPDGEWINEAGIKVRVALPQRTTTAI